MNKVLKSLLCLIMCFSMLAVCLSGIMSDVTEVEAAATQSDVTALQNKKSETQKQLKNLKNQLANLKNNKADQLELKSNLLNQIDLLEDEVNTTESILEAYESMYEVKNVRKTGLELQLQTNYQNFKQAFRYNYMYGQYTDFDLLFSSDRLFDFLSDDEYSQRIFNYDKELIEKLDANTKELEEITAEIDTLIAEKNSYKEELATMKSELEETKSEVNRLIAEIDEQIKNNETLINKANDALTAMDSQIKKMLAEIAAKSTASYVGGKMLFPIPVSAYSRVSSYYGYRTHPVTKKKMSFHTGIDLPASSGTKIFATNAGTVILAQYYGGYGNCVMVDHGGGIVTVYGHCKSLNCTKGQKVNAGDVIGYVGTTGSSTGNHLHFEVRVNGSHVDPIKNGYVVLPK